MKNFVYYIKETFTLFSMEKSLNFFSIISIALILTLLGGANSTIFLGNLWIDILEREADIAVFAKTETENDVEKLLEKIPEIISIKKVSKEEAEDEMEDILGNEKTALKVLKDNPFMPYFRLEVSFKDRETVLKKLGEIPGIDHIRDNKSASDKLKDIINIIKLAGVGLVFIVSFVSIIVVAHIIRQDMTLHLRERTTLRLLGAGEVFLNIPYVLKALLLTMFAGILASLGVRVLIFLFYDNVKPGIIPLPPESQIVFYTISGILITAAILGIIGSFVPVFSKGERL